MRVISGRFKGVALTTPKPGTRPTTDRTKEAIFSHLDSWGVLDDAHVLDLFAGTGALGIEALSRGARELVAVESSAPAATLIAKTLTTLKHNRSWETGMVARVVKARAEKYAAAAAAVSPFEVIFIDPPYAFETESCNQLLAGLADGGLTNERTVIVLERSTRSEEPSAPVGWTITDRRDYGETAVYYIEPDGQ
ncbi:16S rRNA (guanine(966)-N(2))-methyltransferase RsmD [Bifidobacterium sp. UBA6881]|uniref:16S rRNA (guanine(966)-N(2))-methyltransferase RsmD n=1 Tax=Bifidobacterium sp. UBA6881 TaxID=1946109 RepID=UPI000EE35A22|nr:16S rRNA (guanine(966)-N(2))-methyltransferase RsmD [Bifidobacterium sp. UBA6881]HAH53313.1 16S rRNA (guanine(966)-N(2))-methyltransferase RsmD [Bifidobacterium sp.]